MGEPRHESGEDDELLERFLGGDAGAFESLVRRHQDRVYRLALGLLGRREDALDATQEVFLRAFRALAGWRFESRLATWLFRLTLNVCREERRRRWREQLKLSRFLLVVASSRARSHEDPAPSEPALEGLLAKLPRRQREVVLLRVYEELSVEETASVLSIEEGTVKSTLSKAIGTLRRQLTVQPRAVSGGEEPCS